MSKYMAYLLLTLGIFATSWVGCSGSDSKEVIPEMFIPETLLSDGLVFLSEQGSQDIVFKATSEPSVNSNKSWCRVVSIVTASADVYRYTVTVERNSDKEERAASITIKLGEIEKNIPIMQRAATSSGGNESDARAVAKALGLGWNLGNQLDAHNNGVADETAWGNQPATQATFDKLAEHGFTSVRIPVTWLGKVGVAPTYTIDKEWLNRVAECVNYAENANLKAIINIHHDGADSNYWLNIKGAAQSTATNQLVKSQLKAMWEQIAGRFKTKGEFLMFESMNEIHDGGWGWGENLNDGGKQYAVLNEWNQVFVDAVRSIGGQNSSRYLGIPGYCTNVDLTIKHLVLPNDPANRLMVSVHFYDPYTYAIRDEFSEWGHTGATGKKAVGGDEDNVQAVFVSLKSAYIDKGVPVYIGEMGSVNRSNSRAEDFRRYYLEYVCKAAKTYGMAPFYWDNGAAGSGLECFGVVNHATGEFLSNNGKEVVEVMKKAIFTEDSSYTLETVYNNAPK